MNKLAVSSSLISVVFLALFAPIVFGQGVNLEDLRNHFQSLTSDQQKVVSIALKQGDNLDFSEIANGAGVSEEEAIEIYGDALLKVGEILAAQTTPQPLLEIVEKYSGIFGEKERLILEMHLSGASKIKIAQETDTQIANVYLSLKKSLNKIANLPQKLAKEAEQLKFIEDHSNYFTVDEKEVAKLRLIRKPDGSIRTWEEIQLSMNNSGVKLIWTEALIKFKTIPLEITANQELQKDIWERYEEAIKEREEMRATNKNVRPINKDQWDKILRLSFKIEDGERLTFKEIGKRADPSHPIYRQTVSRILRDIYNMAGYEPKLYSQVEKKIILEAIKSNPNFFDQEEINLAVEYFIEDKTPTQISKNEKINISRGAVDGRIKSLRDKAILLPEFIAEQKALANLFQYYWHDLSLNEQKLISARMDLETGMIKSSFNALDRQSGQRISASSNAFRDVKIKVKALQRQGAPPLRVLTPMSSFLILDPKLENPGIQMRPTSKKSPRPTQSQPINRRPLYRK